MNDNYKVMGEQSSGYSELPKEVWATGANDRSYSGDEALLWKAFKEGDAEAYALIYRNYFFILNRYGKKITDNPEMIKDCIQDLFLKIWHNRENLATTTSIKYYLLTALKRKLLDAMRSPHLRLETDSGYLENEWGISDSDMEEDGMLEQKEKVLKALNRLSEHQQRVLKLKFYKNLSNQEIAEELGITIQSVYNSVFKTLKALRRQLSFEAIRRYCYSSFSDHAITVNFWSVFSGRSW